MVLPSLRLSVSEELKAVVVLLWLAHPRPRRGLSSSGTWEQVPAEEVREQPHHWAGLRPEHSTGLIVGLPSLRRVLSIEGNWEMW